MILLYLEKLQEIFIHLVNIFFWECLSYIFLWKTYWYWVKDGKETSLPKVVLIRKSLAVNNLILEVISGERSRWQKLMRSLRPRPPEDTGSGRWGEDPAPLFLITFLRVLIVSSFLLFKSSSFPIIPHYLFLPHLDQMRVVNAETNTKTAISDPPCGNNPFTAFLSARSV